MFYFLQEVINQNLLILLIFILNLLKYYVVLNLYELYLIYEVMLKILKFILRYRLNLVNLKEFFL